MLSEIPKGFEKVRNGDVELARIGMIAELDAINLYEQLGALSKSENLRRVFEDIAREEKTHFGEFLEMLLQLDKEQLKEIEKAKVELFKKKLIESI